MVGGGGFRLERGKQIGIYKNNEVNGSKWYLFPVRDSIEALQKRLCGKWDSSRIIECDFNEIEDEGLKQELKDHVLEAFQIISELGPDKYELKVWLSPFVLRVNNEEEKKTLADFFEKKYNLLGWHKLCDAYILNSDLKMVKVPHIFFKYIKSIDRLRIYLIIKRKW